VRPLVPLSACLEAFLEPEIIDGYYSTAIKGTTHAIKTTRMETFPDYLVLAMKRFVITEGWIPKKTDVWIDVPDTLDFSMLQGKGLQQNEEELPDPDAPGIHIDPSIVDHLKTFGFSEIRAQRAALKTGNAGANEALNWLLEHMDDPDIDAPLSPPKKAATSAAPSAPEESIQSLEGMGFTRDQAIKALKNTNNNVERAVDWLFSHTDSMDTDEPQAPVVSTPDPAADRVRDGKPTYKLLGFISHVGSNTQCGHYVCHIRKEGKWAIFNDCKVAVSEDPPKRLGYLYFYQRTQ